METYLDDLREMRRQVYDLFKYKPELLTGPELSKGEQQQISIASSESTPCLQAASNSRWMNFKPADGVCSKHVMMCKAALVRGEPVTHICQRHTLRIALCINTV
jgi:hypothetical protein